MLVPLLQQEPSVVDAPRYALEEESLAMLNPLENPPLVLQVPEEPGQLFIRGVEGQLRERGDEAGRVLLREGGVGDVEQHGQVGVGALGLASQRQQRRERRHISGGEGQGASQLFLWNQRRGQIGEKSDLVSGGTWTQSARKDEEDFYYIIINIGNGGF